MIQLRIIPEPHIRDQNFETRTDYLTEIRAYMARIMREIRAVASILPEEDKLVVIFDGDVFDRAMQSLGACIEWLQYFMDLQTLTKGNLYSVIGNHEITYKNENVFWMMADLQSEWLEQVNYLTNDTRSIVQTIKITDELVLDNLLVIMGHYRRDLSFYTDEFIKENYPGVTDVIVVSHNTILDHELYNYFKEEVGYDVTYGRGISSVYKYDGLLPPTSMLRKVYVGHMHRAFAIRHRKEQIGNTICEFDLEFLASLGRTNVQEISNNFLKRAIPVITVADGTVEYARQDFMLVGEEVIIDNAKLTANREKYNSAAEFRTLRVTELEIKDPAEDLKRLLGDRSALRNYFICAVNGQLPIEMTDLFARADSLLRK